MNAAQLAIKSIDKSTIADVAGVERVSREYFILTSLEHKNVIRLVEVFQDDAKLYLVMEYAGKAALRTNTRMVTIVVELVFGDILLRYFARTAPLLLYSCVQAGETLTRG